jgi:hypothetical protein
MANRGNEQIHTPEQTGLQPANLIDAFYLQGSDGRTDFFSVAGCIDGSLIVSRDGENGLPTDMQEQVKALKVGNRERFKGITTDTITAFSIAGIEESLSIRGLNDPITLHGTGSTVSRFGDVETRDQKIMVGRLDLLAAYRNGLTYAFRSTDPTNTSGVIVPLLFEDQSRQAGAGENLVLAYPMLDPTTFTYADNSYVTLNLVYDLLLQLQRDVREEKIPCKLSDMAVPAPNKDLLITSLIEDGYVIDGNEAFRKAPGTSEPKKGMLGRLRSIAEDWSADRITLPSEATHEDYAIIIEETLDRVSSTADKNAIIRTQGRLKGDVDSRPRQRIVPTAAARILPTIVSAPKPRPVEPVVPDWQKDFRNTPHAKQNSSTGMANWQRDFDITDHFSKAETREPLVEPSRKHAGQLALTGTAEDASKAKGWQSDFETSTSTGPDSRDQDWQSDFGSRKAEQQQPSNPAPKQPERGWKSDFDG